MKNALRLLFLFFPLYVSSQDYDLSQINYAELQLNPAFTGATELYTLNGNYRNRNKHNGQNTSTYTWFGDAKFELRKKDNKSYIDPLIGYLGVGVSGGWQGNDTMRVFNQKAVSVAYHHVFWDGLKLSGGLQYSVSEQNIAEDHDINAGFLISASDLFTHCDLNLLEAGMAFFGINNFGRSRSENSLGYVPSPKMQFHASVKFLTEDFYVMPSALYKIADKNSWQLGTDIVFSVHHKYHDKVRFGIRYRSDDHFNYTASVRFYTHKFYAVGLNAYGSYDGAGFRKNTSYKNAYEAGIRISYFFACWRLIVC